MSRGVITQLRDLVPLHPLTWVESLHIAEQQALRLLELTGITAPPVPDSVITELPRVEVERITPGIGSGATMWSQGRWLIIINGAHPIGRQRFTLAHEAKHVLDHTFIDVLYPASGGMSAYDRGESVCDYFAACLLMPRPWITAAWEDGQHDVWDLARAFEVSRQAMQVRLTQLGLMRAEPRCIPPERYMKESVR